MELFIILMSIAIGFFVVAGVSLRIAFAPKIQRYSLTQRRRLIDALTTQYTENVEKAKDQNELDDLEKSYTNRYREIESHK